MASVLSILCCWMTNLWTAEINIWSSIIPWGDKPASLLWVDYIGSISTLRDNGWLWERKILNWWWRTEVINSNYICGLAVLVEVVRCFVLILFSLPSFSSLTLFILSLSTNCGCRHFEKSCGKFDFYISSFREVKTTYSHKKRRSVL